MRNEICGGGKPDQVASVRMSMVRVVVDRGVMRTRRGLPDYSVRKID